MARQTSRSMGGGPRSANLRAVVGWRLAPAAMLYAMRSLYPPACLILVGPESARLRPGAIRSAMHGGWLYSGAVASPIWVMASAFVHRRRAAMRRHVAPQSVDRWSVAGEIV